MDKMKMHTPNIADENFQKLAALFPNAVTESIDPETGEVVRSIDADVLRQEISGRVVEGREERYQFTWPDKKKAMLAANAPIAATLRPVRGDSVGRDGTPGGWDSENLYIEGDNLDVLKLLQETYLGKIKIIYIDPPYNTGNDFVYEDDFTDNDPYGYIHERSGQYDDQGFRLVQNTETNGRFHTDWLNMMYGRLRFAKHLLSQDGIIFISIGQNEVHNLINICNEIFGEDNHISTITRIMKSGGAKGRFFSPNVEYILVYCKSILDANNFREPISKEIIDKLYTSFETEGRRKGERYRPFGLYQSSLDARPNQRYYIECPDGELVIPPGNSFPAISADGEMVIPNEHDGCWRWSRDRYLQEKQAGNIAYKKSNGVLITAEGKPSKWNIYTKIWLSDRQDEGMVPVDLITKWENRQSKKELDELGITFDFAKPVELMKYLIQISGTSGNDIIIDFFSGSATTAHAVMQLNAEDGGHRKFIMVQLPEKTDESSEAYKAGYPNICEIGKERIRRAGRKIKDEAGLTAQNLDIGFRVLRLDSSNMQDVYYNPAAMTQDLLSVTTDNIKPDRTPEDLLFQVMLDLGVELSSPITETVIGGKKVYDVADGFLLACFDTGVTTETVTAIAKKQPFYAVFRDSSMANDSVATNFDQIFETYSSATVRKVL